MQIKKITLEAKDLEGLKAFYHETLKLELLSAQTDQFVLQIGSSQMVFRQSQHHYTQPNSPNYHFAFNIPENQLALAKTWLGTLGVELLTYEGKDEIDFPNWNAHALYFLDPASNIVELIARHDLPNASSQPFNQRSLLEISEIGFPVPEIKTFYETLKINLEIPVYSQISNMESFCAAGNPRGLFIIVPLERAWLPTEIINGLFPIEVDIFGTENKQQTFEQLPYQISSIIA